MVRCHFFVVTCHCHVAKCEFADNICLPASDICLPASDRCDLFGVIFLYYLVRSDFDEEDGFFTVRINTLAIPKGICLKDSFGGIE
jgi:hypothetical protein